MAAVNEYRHRPVHARDLPLANDPTEAECAAESEVLLLGAWRSGKLNEYVAESDTIAADGFEIAQSIAERTVPPS